MCLTTSNWFHEMVFFIRMFCLKWDWMGKLVFMIFHVNCFVVATCGCFNGFLMIVWVGTNMLRWLLAKMRKRSYVKFNDAFLQSLQNSLNYESCVVNELLWTWYFDASIWEYWPLLSRCFIELLSLEKIINLKCWFNV